MKQVSGLVLDMDGAIWVELTYDPIANKTRVVIRSEAGGEALASTGYIGKGAEAYFNRMNQYFFGGIRYGNQA